MSKIKYNHHHIIPQSRKGRNNNITIELPIQFHDAIHQVFGNLFGDEMKEFLDWLWNQFRTRDRLTMEDIIAKRDAIKHSSDRIKKRG